MKKIWLAVALVAAILAGVGAAAAVGEGETVKACHNRAGTLKLQVGNTCPKGWTPVEWSVSGPAGEPGAMGPAGPAGPAGPPGAAGSAACVASDIERSVPGPVDGFARFEGILGDSNNIRHLDEVEVMTLRTGVTRPSSDPCSPSALQIDHVVLGTQVGRASVPLTERAATGAVIPEVLITLERAGDRPHAFLQYTLRDVVVASTLTVWEDGVAVEEVSLSFDRIEWVYTPQRVDGSSGDPIRFCFDVPAEAAC